MPETTLEGLVMTWDGGTPCFETEDQSQGSPRSSTCVIKELKIVQGARLVLSKPQPLRLGN